MFAKFFIFTVSSLVFVTACTPAIPSSTNVPPAVSETSTPPAVSEETPTAQPSRTPQPTATQIPLQLLKIETLPDNCMDMEQGLPGNGLSEVAYLPSGFCFHGELDMFETGGHVYVAQVVMAHFPSQEAFRIVDVTDAEQPVQVGAWKWTYSTYSADIKAFRQGDRWFLALSRETDLASNERCNLNGGIAIIEVTEPTEPSLLGMLTSLN